jgi:hypothetical protein
MAKLIDLSQDRAAMHSHSRTGFGRVDSPMISHEELGAQLQLEAGQAVTGS